MAYIQDSSGLPSTSPGSSRRITKGDIQRMIAAAVKTHVDQSVGSAVNERFSDFFRVAGRTDERVQIELRDLKSQNEALRQELKELRAFIQETSDKYHQHADSLKVSFSESEAALQDIKNEAAKLKADLRQIKELLEFQEAMAGAASWAIVYLERGSRWCNRAIRALEPFARKILSSADGKEITKLVERSNRRRRADD